MVKEEKKGEDRYLDANQKSERFVPVPCRHVPYLSQILWCSRTGQNGPRFHLTGRGTRRSVHHYQLCNQTGTLERDRQLAVDHSAHGSQELRNRSLTNIPCGSSSEGANSGGVWVLAVMYLDSEKTAESCL